MSRMCWPCRLALGELEVGLGQAVDEDAHEGLVEGHLAAVGGGAKGIGFDLEDGDLVDGDDGGGAPAGGAGEVENLAEAAALDDGGERPAHQRDADLALDEQEDAL